VGLEERWSQDEGREPSVQSKVVGGDNHPDYRHLHREARTSHSFQHDALAGADVSGGRHGGVDDDLVGLRRVESTAFHKTPPLHGRQEPVVSAGKGASFGDARQRDSEVNEARGVDDARHRRQLIGDLGVRT
jgi:hypothetical protein